MFSAEIWNSAENIACLLLPVVHGVILQLLTEVVIMHCCVSAEGLAFEEQVQACWLLLCMYVGSAVVHVASAVHVESAESRWADGNNAMSSLWIVR